MFPRHFRIILAAAAVGITAAACQMMGNAGSADASTDADTIAAAVADPSNGLTQEGADVGSYIFSAGTVDSSSYALYFCGDLSGFAWNGSTQAYERTGTNLVFTLPNRTVQISSVFVQVRFYTSTDTSGSSQQVPLGSGLDSSIHSLTYYRTISGTTTDSTTGTGSAFSGTSTLAYTNIDTAAHTVTVNGTHSRSFTRTFSNGRISQGTITDTLTSLVITYNPTNHVFSWSGSLAYAYNANVTRSNGTQVSRQSSGTITLSGSATFVIDVDDVPYGFSMLDGSAT